MPGLSLALRREERARSRSLWLCPQRATGKRDKDKTAVLCRTKALRPHFLIMSFCHARLRLVLADKAGVRLEELDANNGDVRN